MTNRLLDRLQYVPSPSKLERIPWPDGLVPTIVKPQPEQLPTTDVLIVTYTASEAQALADVLTPGHPSKTWAEYRTGWDKYEPHLVPGRSPALESGCLGAWAAITIGQKKVALFKSDLHLSTDDETLPVRMLLEQIIEAVNPQLVITTGTAGGVGAVELGDVLLAGAVKFNCTEAFSDEQWAQRRYPSPGVPGPGPNLALAFQDLVSVNAGKLDLPGNRSPQLVTGDLETMGFFGFADPTDYFGVLANDHDARMVDMDDGVIPLALETMGGAAHGVDWLSIRNTSDPEPGPGKTIEEEEESTHATYKKYGYWTSVGSAITCWATVADM
jgi:nucleoside phosphorylase